MPDRISEVYLGTTGAPEQQALAQKRIQWMLEQLGDSSPALEVGCSQGIISLLAARKGLRITGVDVEAASLEHARALLAQEPPKVQEKASFNKASVYDLPFEQDRFEAVLFGETLEHLDRPERALEQICRVLKPGGRLILTTPLGFLYDPEHVQTFLPDDLAALVSKGFQGETLQVLEHYLLLTARKGEGGFAPELIAACWAQAGAQLIELQQAHHRSRLEVVKVKKQLADVNERFKALMGRFNEAKAKLQFLESSKIAVLVAPYEKEARRALRWVKRLR